MSLPSEEPVSPVESPRLRWLFSGVTVVILGLVLLALTVPAPRAAPSGPTLLASLGALLNGTITLLLVAGTVFIKRRAVVHHRRCMMAAFALSCVFLLTYLAHHAQVGTVKFQGQGLARTLYFSLLLPHIAMAAPVVPLALLTVYRGRTGRIAAHRRIARWALPIWLFVSASGVAVYFMLYHWPV